MNNYSNFMITIFVSMFCLPGVAAETARGKSIWQNSCASCHTNNSTGLPKKLGRSSAQINTAISNVGAMRGLSSLAAEDINEVTKYLSTTNFRSPVSFKRISNKALFSRCYTKITEEFPSITSTYLTALKNGADPISECLKIFDKAMFTASAGTMLADTNSAEARKVVSTMHNLHYSWFRNKFYKEVRDSFVGNMGIFMDTSSPALFYTKSLFDSNFKFSDMFKGELTLRAERTTSDPEISAIKSSAKKSTDIISSDTKYADTGKLIGISILSANTTLSYNYNRDRDGVSGSQVTGTRIYNSSWGGGVLGSQVYMLQNSSANSLTQFKPNGAITVNRQWGISVVKDFLCRDLPLTRELDSKDFAVPDSSVAFRQAVGCVKCHTTMDRMAALTRNIQYVSVGHWFHSASLAPLKKRVASKPGADIFPSENDSDYYLRPATGHLFLRSHNGNLTDVPLTDVEDLGSKLIALDGPYVCAAKRYYHYLTGINADIGDIGDPAHPRFKRMSKQELKYRNIVIKLGKKLKTHQNPRQLIEEILRSREFSELDYGLGAK